MEPKVSLIISGNLYMRQMRFENKGDIENGHCHTYDHLTLLTSGSLKVSVDDIETIFEAPTAIKILANKQHQLEALEENTLAYCVHALREAATEDVLPPSAYTVNEKSKVFEKTETGLLVKPNMFKVKVDDKAVELAPIAKFDKQELDGSEFNRNQDSNPIVVKTPDGKLEQHSSFV